MGGTPTRFPDDVQVNGTLSVGTAVNLPTGSIKNAAFSSGASDRLAASKVVHRFPLNYTQASGGDVATATALLHLAGAAGTIMGIEVRPITAPTGGDKNFTVDLQKAADAGSFATVLSGAMTIDSSSVDATKETGTVDSSKAAYTAGTALQLVVTAGGTTGSQGQGVIITVYVEENPS